MHKSTMIKLFLKIIYHLLDIKSINTDPENHYRSKSPIYNTTIIFLTMINTAINIKNYQLVSKQVVFCNFCQILYYRFISILNSSHQRESCASTCYHGPLLDWDTNKVRGFNCQVALIGAFTTSFIFISINYTLNNLNINILYAAMIISYVE